jgi:hypothetical protein
MERVVLLVVSSRANEETSGRIVGLCLRCASLVLLELLRVALLVRM